MRTQNSIFCFHSQWHGANKNFYSLIHNVSIVSKFPIQSSAKKRCIFPRTLAHHLIERLGKFMVGQHHMHLPRILHNQCGGLGKHVPTHVRTIDQSITMDQLMKNEMILRFFQLSKRNHLHKMKWIVMQVARDKKPTNISKMHAATAPL